MGEREVLQLSVQAAPPIKASVQSTTEDNGLPLYYNVLAFPLVLIYGKSITVQTSLLI